MRPQPPRALENGGYLAIVAKKVMVLSCWYLAVVAKKVMLLSYKCWSLASYEQWITLVRALFATVSASYFQEHHSKPSTCKFIKRPNLRRPQSLTEEIRPNFFISRLYSFRRTVSFKLVQILKHWTKPNLKPGPKLTDTCTHRLGCDQILISGQQALV